MPPDGEGDDYSPRMTREIENNLLLKQAIIDIRSMKGTIDANHLQAIEIRDKKTIEHVETIWSAFKNVRWLFAAAAAVLGILYITKSLWNWP
jgi:hypothetical protein